MIQFDKKELRPRMLNNTLSRSKLKAVLDFQTKANNASIFRFVKRTKKARIASYYCNTLGYFPATNVPCTKHELLGEAIMSQCVTRKNGKTCMSATMKNNINLKEDPIITSNKG